MAIKFLAVITCDYPGCDAEEAIDAEQGCKGPVARASKFYARGWGYKVPTHIKELQVNSDGKEYMMSYKYRGKRTYLCPEHNKAGKE